MRVEYDHYSKQCPSHPIPPIHPDDVEILISKVFECGVIELGTLVLSFIHVCNEEILIQHNQRI